MWSCQRSVSLVCFSVKNEWQVRALFLCHCSQVTKYVVFIQICILWLLECFNSIVGGFTQRFLKRFLNSEQVLWGIRKAQFLWTENLHPRFLAGTKHNQPFHRRTAQRFMMINGFTVRLNNWSCCLQPSHLLHPNSEAASYEGLEYC